MALLLTGPTARSTLAGAPTRGTACWVHRGGHPTGRRHSALPVQGSAGVSGARLTGAENVSWSTPPRREVNGLVGPSGRSGVSR